MAPLYSADLSSEPPTISCVFPHVAVMWQATWSTASDSVRKENGLGGESPSCTTSSSQSIESALSLGGVPVFRRPRGRPTDLNDSDSL
jgi:hypothetical protein